MNAGIHSAHRQIDAETGGGVPGRLNERLKRPHSPPPSTTSS
jgi:hypothetical protein